MTAKKLILIIVIILILGVFSFWYFGRMANTPAENSTGQLPLVETGTPAENNGGASISANTSSLAVPLVSVPTGDTIAIGTSQGTVVMKNFYKNAAIVSADGSGALINDDHAYNISYSTYDSSFSISLLQTPVAVARTQAEAAFLQNLGISKEDACKLKVTVEVPIGVDPQNAGINLGLSFCNNAIQPQ
jgi:hypothetical protein